MIFLKLVDKQGNTLAQSSGISIDFSFDRVYEEGDKFIIKLRDCGQFIAMKLDESLKESIVMIPDKFFEYTLPYGPELIAYDEESFKKSTHRVTVREAEDDEVYSPRVISENSIFFSSTICSSVFVVAEKSSVRRKSDLKPNCSKQANTSPLNGNS